MKIYPVILSGGAGTRLWPLSREHYPKPLLPLASEYSMLQETAQRLHGFPGDVASPIVVCNEEHRFLVAEQLAQSGDPPATIVLEPEGRNTAPALTLAALQVEQQDPQGVMVIMPADHIIRDRERFRQAVISAHDLAREGMLVTFGIVPDRAETGYGYIRKGAELHVAGSFRVDRFVEKPDAGTAAQYLDSGDYLWNSGIFVMRCDRWLEELDRFRPEIATACRVAAKAGNTDARFFRVDRERFLECPSDSIDYAVMEKTDGAAVVPLDSGWSDVGAWSSLWDVGAQDDAGNVVQGDVFTHDIRNALLVAEHRCVAVVGLQDVVVIETADAVLVADKNRAQDVKSIVEQLKIAQRDEYKMHRRVYRPWGTYEGVDAGDRFQVKRLVVKPGASLSLQLHHHRAEHWVVVKGTAKVTRGDEEFLLAENESTFIPQGMKHRLHNPGEEPLEIIEVQSGSYLGEDDIVRFEDIYDRCAES